MVRKSSSTKNIASNKQLNVGQENICTVERILPAVSETVREELLKGTKSLIQGRTKSTHAPKRKQDSRST
jgi:hypothetical protein